MLLKLIALLVLILLIYMLYKATPKGYVIPPFTERFVDDFTERFAVSDAFDDVPSMVPSLYED